MSITIKAKRLNAEFDKEEEFYWFYVSIHLEEDGPPRLKEIALVEYHLLDETIDNGDVRVTSPADGFAYRMWLYGFIKVSADVITKEGEKIIIPSTNLEWTVTPAEVKANGKRELSWS